MILHSKEAAAAVNPKSAQSKVPERHELLDQDKWDLSRIYKSVQEWQDDFEKLDSMIKPVEEYRGKLNSAVEAAEFLTKETELERLAHQLYVYAHLKADENTADSENQAREQQIRQKLSELSGRLAWARPELLNHSEEELREWMDNERLKDYRYDFKRVLRLKPHTLSDKEETILSYAGNIFAAPGQVFSMLTNADMTFPVIKDETGQEQELSQGRYLKFLKNRDRSVRRSAFEALHDTYGRVKNTTACTLRTQVATHNFKARIRKYESALAAALTPDNIPLEVYNGLIEAVHKALPIFFRYVDLRAKQLKLEHLDMYDMYVPIVADFDIEIPFEQAQEWVLAASKPLGAEYCTILETAFSERWIDVYENRGKRSGAYSSGSYDTLPYVLLNYQGTLNDVFTLAHELGHSMHSWLANHNQPPTTAEYPIFIAEIASTTSEALLLQYLLKEQKDPAFRAYLFNHFCDGFRGTVYRQTMFAEFEKIIHEKEAEGESLTPASLCSYYGELNQRFHGERVVPDSRISLEWSRIPHFYYNFYVYKYATSFCASQLFFERILKNDKQRDQYLDLLKAGGSDDPLVLIKNAGVDLAEKETLEQAFGGFDRSITELTELLER